MRLIDADAIQIPSTYVDLFENCRNCKLLDREQVREIIDNTPTIEPKRGWWETVFMSEATGWDVSIAGRDPIYGHRCSICKEEAFINDVGEEMLTNFCPNCGADMRKGADDE